MSVKLTPEQRQALDAFAAAVRARYGDRLVDILVFGSRARGDAREDSDIDLAVILQDGDWRFWTEKRWLAGLGYEPLVETGLRIQPWPVRLSDWQEPTRHRNPSFLVNIKRDGRHIREAA